jgi:hypothetical protein
MKLNGTINSKLNSQDLSFFFKKNSALLNLQILKSRIYEKRLCLKNSLFEIEEKFMQLKIILLVIYSYHLYNKTILFIGIPEKIISILKRMSDYHIFLPSKIWLKRGFSQKNSVRKHPKFKSVKKRFTRNKINKLFILIKIPKLVVIMSPFTNLFIMEEIYKLRLPVITLNSNKNFIDKFFYQIHENSIKADFNLNTVFSNLLNSLFFKSNFFFKLFKDKINYNINIKYQRKVINRNSFGEWLKNSFKKDRSVRLLRKSVNFIKAKF